MEKFYMKDQYDTEIKKPKRNFIGSEISEEYVNISNKDIKNINRLDDILK
jgi:DNA modification methylase